MDWNSCGAVLLTGSAAADPGGSVAEIQVYGHVVSGQV